MIMPVLPLVEVYVSRDGEGGRSVETTDAAVSGSDSVAMLDTVAADVVVVDAADVVSTDVVVVDAADVVSTDVSGSVVAVVIVELAVRGELAMLAAGGSDSCGFRAWLCVPDELTSCKSTLVLQDTLHFKE